MNQDFQKRTEQSSTTSNLHTSGSSTQHNAFATAKSPMANVNGDLTLGGHLMWFAFGLISGVFGMIAAWLFTKTWAPNVRSQSVWAAWAGFAVQVVVTIALYSAGFFTDAGAMQATAEVTTSVAFG